MKSTIIILAGISAATATTYFQDTFDSDPFTAGWVHSEWKKKSESGEFKWTAGEWSVDASVEKGLMTTQDARFHAISNTLSTPIPPYKLGRGGKDLVLQFSAKNHLREYSFCGGGYIKLLPTLDSAKFGGESPYSIMFGPDMCGYDVSRIHAIFTNKGGTNLLKSDEIKLEHADKNEFTHVYTLHIKSDGSYEVLFDGNIKASGRIEDHWDFEKKNIDDITDKKPSDWVDEEMIDDPDDVKPDGYDDIPKEIADPEAKQPDDWDEEDDGEWEAPMIANPDYKGTWSAKRIKNPAFKGVWKPRQVPNPKYDEDLVTFPELTNIGFELWTVNNGTIFDNIYVGDSIDDAKTLSDSTYGMIKEKEKSAKESWEKARKNEAPAEEEEEDEDEGDTESGKKEEL
jgi:calreticulin